MQCMNILDHLTKNHPKNFTKTSSMDREAIEQLSSLILKNLDGSKLQ